MKVGDLIQLSAYGRKLKSYQYTSIWPDRVGVLVEVSPPNYTVFWSCGKRWKHFRTDIKLAKVKKENQK